MKKIPLTRGQHALVDDVDYEALSTFKWMYHNSGYASRTMNHIMMHRVIMGAAKGELVDHINGNKLDNRRENLRIATRSQNNANTVKRKDNTSGYRGVSKEHRGKRYRVQIQHNGKKIAICGFKTPEDAAKAYNQIAKELHGDFAKLNEGVDE